MGAICRECNKDMLLVDSCVEVPVKTINGDVLEPIKYNILESNHERCHDCGVKLGGYHHRGCDMERCPNCSEQLISCGCWED